ncbi:MAG: hypothetical protein IT161_21250 [Bryobacterales bacterium]|nr:hypothetical protein [Bryobacterales bacterium]
MRIFFAFAGFALLGSAADLSPQQADDIVAKFAAKEADFAKARENYTYRQTVRVQELDDRGVPRGKYELVSDIIFSEDGKRTEKVIRAPMSTLQRIQLTPQDEQDLRAVQPFVLTTKDIGDYDVRYLGKEKLDEVGCYAFAVKPKKMVEGRRYFAGIVWVDDQDLQIVKTYGRGVGLEKHGGDHKYPKFETYREQVDGKYWFPTYTRADDTLNFDAGPVPIKMLVKYEDYKQFKSESKITFGDEVTGDKDQKQPKKP